jgi:hypothetical protein
MDQSRHPAPLPEPFAALTEAPGCRTHLTEYQLELRPGCPTGGSLVVTPVGDTASAHLLAARIIGVIESRRALRTSPVSRTMSGSAAKKSHSCGRNEGSNIASESQMTTISPRALAIPTLT